MANHSLYRWNYFLIQAYKGNKSDSILAGVIFLGFGIHFHVVHTLKLWPNELGIFILIISLGLMLQGSKAKSGMLPGFLLLVVALILLFKEKMFELLGIVQSGIGASFPVWSILLVGLGVALLFIKK